MRWVISGQAGGWGKRGTEMKCSFKIICMALVVAGVAQPTMAACTFLPGRDNRAWENCMALERQRIEMERIQTEQRIQQPQIQQMQQQQMRRGSR
jgi:hypothetical protein